MKTLIKDLVGGEAFDSCFYVSQARVRKAKNQSKYIQATLVDKTGQIEGRMWDAAQETLKSNFPVGTVVRMTGHVDVYKNINSLTIKDARPAEESEYDMNDIVMSSSFDLDALGTEFLDYIDEVSNEHLKALLKKVFESLPLWQKFSQLPAARNNHHCFRGGLLEHSCMMARAAASFCESNPRLDKDILVAGAMLHDIGKVWNYKDYLDREITPPVVMLGHIFLGANYVDKAISGIDGFPQELRMLVLHMILSHHGKLEWGSPVAPATTEAMTLHYIDMIDSRSEYTSRLIRSDPDPTSVFTDYLHSFGTSLYKGETQE